ncbi:MAG: hypothetical protein ACLPY1_14605 [Terracidiphilus sp.]
MNWKIAGARADGYGITLALEAAGKVEVRLHGLRTSAGFQKAGDL